MCDVVASAASSSASPPSPVSTALEPDVYLDNFVETIRALTESAHPRAALSFIAAGALEALAARLRISMDSPKAQASLRVQYPTYSSCSSPLLTLFCTPLLLLSLQNLCSRGLRMLISGDAERRTPHPAAHSSDDLDPYLRVRCSDSNRPAFLRLNTCDKSACVRALRAGCAPLLINGIRYHGTRQGGKVGETSLSMVKNACIAFAVMLTPLFVDASAHDEPSAPAKIVETVVAECVAAGAIETIVAALRAHGPADVFVAQSALDALIILVDRWRMTDAGRPLCVATAAGGYTGGVTGSSGCTTSSTQLLPAPIPAAEALQIKEAAARAIAAGCIEAACAALRGLKDHPTLVNGVPVAPLVGWVASSAQSLLGVCLDAIRLQPSRDGFFQVVVPSAEALNPVSRQLQPPGAPDSSAAASVSAATPTIPLLPSEEVFISRCITADYLGAWADFLRSEAHAGVVLPAIACLSAGRDGQDLWFRLIEAINSAQNDGDPARFTVTMGRAGDIRVAAAPLPGAGGAAAASSAAAAAASSSSPRCDCCGEVEAPGRKLKLCTGCRGVRYCGEVCQLLAWKHGHNKECGFKRSSSSMADTAAGGAPSHPAKESAV